MFTGFCGSTSTTATFESGVDFTLHYKRKDVLAEKAISQVALDKGAFAQDAKPRRHEELRELGNDTFGKAFTKYTHFFVASHLAAEGGPHQTVISEIDSAQNKRARGFRNPRARNVCFARSGDRSARNQTIHDDDNGDHEEQVNQSATNVHDEEAQQPQHEENYRDSPQHAQVL